MNLFIFFYYRRLQEAGFPIHLLPDVTIAGNIVGHMPHAWYGIPEGTPVFAALGDLQCSVFSSMETESDAGKKQINFFRKISRRSN